MRKVEAGDRGGVWGLGLGGGVNRKGEVDGNEISTDGEGRSLAGK